MDDLLLNNFGGGIEYSRTEVAKKKLMHLSKKQPMQKNWMVNKTANWMVKFHDKSSMIIM